MEIKGLRINMGKMKVMIFGKGLDIFRQSPWTVEKKFKIAALVV